MSEPEDQSIATGPLLPTIIHRGDFLILGDWVIPVPPMAPRGERIGLPFTDPDWQMPLHIWRIFRDATMHLTKQASRCILRLVEASLSSGSGKCHDHRRGGTHDQHHRQAVLR